MSDDPPSRPNAAEPATLYRCRTPSDWLCPCGHVARELAKHAVTLLGSLPDPELPNVIASRLDGR